MTPTPSRLRLVLLAVAAACAASALPGAAAAPGAPPTAAERRAAPDAGAVHTILPPGQDGTYTAGDVAAFQARQARPANTVDQLALYDALNRLAPEEITATSVRRLFKDGALGVAPDQVTATARPRTGVTVLRDRFAVPHVYGVTDADVAFGAGYAGTQDRMFLQDVLRHYGAARLSEFLGPSAGNVAMDRAQLRSAPYTAEEAARQIEELPRRYPGEGEELQRRLDAFVAGINQAQREACPAPTAPGCPAEYAALQVVPRDWVRADVVFVASLVGGIFGSGGGEELANARFLQTVTGRLGPVAGRRAFDDFMRHDDPEAPTTVRTRFPYNQYGRVDAAAVSLPDAGAPTAPGSGDPAGGARASSLRVATPGFADGPLGAVDLRLKTGGMSNALVVNGSESTSGHPLAVFGPQVGYASPQLLVEIGLYGPSVAARGASFPGTQFVVQLGHGVDYAWSATSANSDNVDVVADVLCEADGSRATVESESYLDAAGRCVPLDVYTHREVAKPSAGGAGAPQVLEFRVLRTRHGVVQTRTTSGGTPVAYVLQRSTYGGEFDSAVGFLRINNPGYVRSAADFRRAFSAVDYTFNWFYVDSRDAAYYSSGLLPVRAPGIDPRLPRLGTARYDWRGWLPEAAHPRAVNPPQGYLTSWNNKPAPGWTAADDQYGFGPVYRSLSLDARLRPLLAGSRRATLPQVVGAMQGAATADPRGQQLLPELLAVLGDAPRHRVAAQLLRGWQARGAQRVDRDRDGAYADQAAIALFDAWYEDVARTVFTRVLGKDVVAALPGRIDDHPRVTPGGFNAVGMYGWLDKDLRQALRRPVAGRFSRTYCGGGVPAVCRADVQHSLDRVLAGLAERQGTSDPRRFTYDKRTDQLRSGSIGLVGVPAIDFQNRPTFQQVVEFRRRR